jgi:signal transduction histidine kinase
MNFLRETRVFSALSVALLELVMIVTFLFTLQIDEERGYMFARHLFNRHTALREGLRTAGIVPSIPLGEGNPPLLGAAIVLPDGKENFFPPAAQQWWKILPPALRDPASPLRLKPVRASDIYVLPVVSFHEGYTYVSFFDGSSRRAADLRLRTLAAIVLLSAMVLPVLTWLFLRRAARLYAAVVEEARRSPVARDFTDEPASVIGALRRTNEELERLLGEARTRADDLSILTGTLSRNIPSGLLVLDAGDVPLECNRQAQEMLGLPPSEGEPLDSLLGSWPRFLETIHAALKTREPLSRVEILDNGKSLGITLAPLFTSDRRILGTLILFTDLSPWKKIEEELRVKGNLAALGTFASGIAHEFRNSLGTLLGYMKLLEKGPDPEKRRVYLEALLREGNHLNQVVSRFLDYIRLNTIQPEAAGLAGILEEALAGLRSAYPDIRFILKGEEVRIRADPHLLGQAVRAVAENACQAQSEGEIEIVWKKERNRIRLDIRDHGPGIPPGQRDEIFVPFFTSKSGGTGLGLALAQKILLLHGGTLEHAPRPEGGTVFTFHLNGEDVTI